MGKKGGGGAYRGEHAEVLSGEIADRFRIELHVAWYSTPELYQKSSYRNDQAVDVRMRWTKAGRQARGKVRTPLPYALVSALGQPWWSAAFRLW